MILALLVTGGCATVEERATNQAADLARTDIKKLAERMGSTLASTTDPEEALPRARQAAGEGVYSVVVLGSARAAEKVTVDLAVAQRATVGGGLSSSTQIVRICVSLAGQVGQQRVSIQDLDCPPGLSPLVGTGSVTAVVPYDP